MRGKDELKECHRDFRFFLGRVNVFKDFPHNNTEVWRPEIKGISVSYFSMFVVSLDYTTSPMKKRRH